MKRISLVSIFLGIKKSQLKFFFKKYSYTGYFVFRPPPPHPHHAQHASSPSAHPTSDVNFYDPLATPFQVTIGFIFCQLFSFHFPQFFYLFNFSFFLLKLLKIFCTDKEIQFSTELFSGFHVLASPKQENFLKIKIKIVYFLSALSKAF